MAHELDKLGVHFEIEKVFPVTYDGISIEFGYRVDLLVEGVAVVEIKAVENILPVHEAQLLSYLKLSGIRVGYSLTSTLLTCVKESDAESVGTEKEDPCPPFA